MLFEHPRGPRGSVMVLRAGQRLMSRVALEQRKPNTLRLLWQLVSRPADGDVSSAPPGGMQHSCPTGGRDGKPRAVETRRRAKQSKPVDSSATTIVVKRDRG